METVYEQKTERDHILERAAMYIGSTEPHDTSMFLYDSEAKAFRLELVRFAPGWYKIIDEVIVNCIDQWVKHPDKVTRIDIDFDPKGVVRVRNNGPAIPLEKTDKTANGEVLWTPTMLFGRARSGSNWGDGRTGGGMNGIGVKATNVMSKWFEVRICDGKKLFTQRFESNMGKECEPVIEKVAKAEKFVEVQFRPDYKRFGCLVSKEWHVLNKLIYTRAIQAMVCTDAEVYYNSLLIHFDVETPKRMTAAAKAKVHMRKFEFFCQRFLSEGDQVLVFELQEEVGPKGETPNGGQTLFLGVAASTSGYFQQVSLINGINVNNGGNHLTELKKQIVQHTKECLEKEVKKYIKDAKVSNKDIEDSLFLLFKGCVINPEFTSQSKEQLCNGAKQFAQYSFDKKQLASVWGLLKEELLDKFIKRTQPKEAKRTKVDNIEKYFPARKAGHKKDWIKTVLFICEGDSAMGAAKTGITSQSTEISWDLFGIYSIQGVPINSHKQSTERNEAVIRSQKLQANERINNLVKILGLSYEKKYELSETGDQEFQTLRYGCVTILVDQDLDGYNIYGLLITFFHRFWPALFKRNFFKKLDTPIIRVYADKQRRKLKQEFYNRSDYDTWVEREYDGHQDRIPSTWSVVYYKGLASHSPLETARLFMNFYSKVIHLESDPEIKESIETYYGKDTANRKIALKTPHEPLRQQVTQMKVSFVLRCFVKEAQRYNILRKLSHVVDGMTLAKRKVLYAARHHFKHSNESRRVSTFAGDVQSYSHYHHGEASLNQTIIGMAQCFRGAKHIPMLYPEGNFGNYFNRKNSGSPRYVATRLNKAVCFAMFPERDDPVLTYEFDEGHRCEPEYFVPVLPMALLEHVSIPGTGWKCQIWARDFERVVEHTLQLIETGGKGDSNRFPMGIWKDHEQCKIVKHNGKLHSVGAYVLPPNEPNMIVVTDLPLTVMTEQFMEAVQKKHLEVLDGTPIDDSLADGSKVWIELKFKKGIVEKIMSGELSKRKVSGASDRDDSASTSTESGPKDDPVIDFLNLSLAMTPALNLIAPDKGILEFARYDQILLRWFWVRKTLYEKRIARELVLLRLRATYLENIIRFSKEHERYKITSRVAREKVDRILAEEKYDRFHHTLLESPKYFDVEYLRQNVLNAENSSFDYLMNLRYSDLIANACAKREEQHRQLLLEIKELEEDLAPKSLFTGQKTWTKEVLHAAEVVREGVKNKWGIKYELDVPKKH